MANLELVKFKFEHMRSVKNTLGENLIPPTQAVILERSPSFSGFIDGEYVGSAGIVKIWPRRWQAWAHLALPAKEAIRSIVRATRAFCDLIEGRIEAAVPEDFPGGDRFARACGFEKEGFMRHYFADGRGATLYARVR